MLNEWKTARAMVHQGVREEIRLKPVRWIVLAWFYVWTALRVLFTPVYIIVAAATGVLFVVMVGAALVTPGYLLATGEWNVVEMLLGYGFVGGMAAVIHAGRD